jgi:methyl-accepting chemotaxis protein
MEKNNKVKVKGYNMKILALIAIVFVLGAGTAVTLYATGERVIETGDNIFMVSHTEYRYGEQGQIVTRLVDFQDNAIAVTNCTATILNPDKSFLYQDQLMNDSGNINGDHYFVFTTPAGPEGVYEYQATCNYGVNKQKSATNSFHLSSGFNSVLSNLTAISGDISAFRAEVASNMTAVIDAISSINVTADVASIKITIEQANATINTVNSNLDAFVLDVDDRLSELNATTQQTQTIVTELQATIDSINLTVNSLSSSLSDLTSTINNINTTVTATNDLFTLPREWMPTARPGENFTYTEVIDWLTDGMEDGFATQEAYLTSISSNLTTYYNDLSAQIQNVNLTITNQLTSFEQTVQTNFSQVLSAINGINITISTPIDYTAVLDEINATTHSTYEYMTGTLASNVNDVFTTLGVINATVARIETTTNNINATANQILQNQEDQVYMNTYSG